MKAGEREIVRKEEGEEKESARGSVHCGCNYATSVEVEADPQRHRLGRRESDFALECLEECRGLETDHVRVVALR